jgi:hypothetical protein
MKTFLRILILVAIVCGVAVVTCPKNEAHVNAIKEVVFEAMSENSDDETNQLGRLFFDGITNYAIGSLVTYENHFLYSTASIKSPAGTRKRLSTGVFGHVFTVNKEEMAEMVGI